MNFRSCFLFDAAGESQVLALVNWLNENAPALLKEFTASEQAAAEQKQKAAAASSAADTTFVREWILFHHMCVVHLMCCELRFVASCNMCVVCALQVLEYEAQNHFRYCSPPQLDWCVRCCASVCTHLLRACDVV